MFPIRKEDKVFTACCHDEGKRYGCHQVDGSREAEVLDLDLASKLAHDVGGQGSHGLQHHHLQRAVPDCLESVEGPILESRVGWF